MIVCQHPPRHKRNMTRWACVVYRVHFPPKEPGFESCFLLTQALGDSRWQELDPWHLCWGRGWSPLLLAPAWANLGCGGLLRGKPTMEDFSASILLVFKQNFWKKIKIMWQKWDHSLIIYLEGLISYASYRSFWKTELTSSWILFQST